MVSFFSGHPVIWRRKINQSLNNAPIENNEDYVNDGFGDMDIAMNSNSETNDSQLSVNNISSESTLSAPYDMINATDLDQENMYQRISNDTGSNTMHNETNQEYVNQTIVNDKSSYEKYRDQEYEEVICK
ncbi:unnamed protein product [Owenia fusiformis]|uniref:Uncharacterized protein n=1 Tax=Owenia fusiformis TaxID=6347 RepID=A0A8S4Q7X1_OWEFU|nr:unnamed protein product [Owenia fusiformis]